MKAVAAALVLIAGAAVVLWYGNTLNSWVLGGLIGGLAALLLSIPISLTVFSYLSRRHDEQLRAEVQEEMSLAQMYDYPDPAAIGAGRRYMDEGYALEKDWVDDEDEQGYPYPSRALPMPAPQNAPVVSQNRLPAVQRGIAPQALKGQQRIPPAARGKEAPGRRTTGRHTTYYPGFPGYDPGAFRSRALRTAREEAMQQQADDVEVLPPNASRRPAPPRSTRHLPEQTEGSTSTRARKPGPQQAPYPRRIVDASSSQGFAQRALPADRGTNSGQYSGQNDPHSGYLEGNYPQTGPVYPPTTGQIERHPHIEEQLRNPDAITGTLKNPLVRRPPYLYEDDPLRQELAQQIDRPAVRRSSRLEALRQRQQENDEES
jgi:hypothetical protein